ncbi:hypothetical protein RB195_019749 [Necator americanus]|uniref:Uncharacterized protein n=1 Tax=Necator americanus TaxID=51031 RepID=A0ABR1CFM0_NECAM
MDVKSGAGCVHAYTALLYAGVGCVRDRPYSNDRDEGMIDVVVGDDVENENGVGKSSADIEYRHRDIFRRMEMKYVPAREFLFKAKGRKWRAHLRNEEQAKRKPTLDISDARREAPFVRKEYKQSMPWPTSKLSVY